MKNICLVLLLTLLFSCVDKKENRIEVWLPYDQASFIEANNDHPSVRMRYQLIQSRVADKNLIWKAIAPQINDFTQQEYERLKTLVLDKSIPEIQQAISDGQITYQQLTKWYLYRIVLFENDSATALNNIISINPEAVKQAALLDEKGNKSGLNSIYGMPILLKDNVNTSGMPTTAGAAVLMNNNTEDAFITQRLKENGAIILGKTNLSEWANFLCLECPNGYSAVGGQTLNPYGPRQFDTGGSSAGSGSAVAANYAVAAIGTETSGSILSPSSANSIVGLKPTVGVLSRGGIVPISSTLDTPGPMTKSVIDNAILFQALLGIDSADKAMVGTSYENGIIENLDLAEISGKRFGVIKDFMTDSLYLQSINKIKDLGGVLVGFEQTEVNLDGFLSLLNADMKIDLPHYLEKYGNKDLSLKSVKDVIELNNRDSAVNIPYGQGRFYGVLNEELSLEALDSLKRSIMSEGVRYFETPMNELNLDFILSVNNWTAGYAAVAHYPCLTVPMGYGENGEPKGLTFISKPYTEKQLLAIGSAYEKGSAYRKIPLRYQ